MPYLIDGHNLIHYLGDIELDDPYDEAKLVLKLRGFCARSKKKVVVVFDHGLPGGYSQLSTPSVTVIFASANQTNADRIIRERIGRIRDHKGWTVISSDNEVLDSARHAGLKGMKCIDFADILMRPTQQPLHKGENPNVMVSPQEVEEWLNMFGVDADETFIDQVTQRKASDPPRYIDVEHPHFDDEPQNPPHPKSQPKPKKRDLARIKNADHEVAQWLDVFGEDPQREATDKARKIDVRGKRQVEPEPDHSTDEINEAVKEGDLTVSENSVDAWMDVFGEVDTERKPTDDAFQRGDPGKQGRYRNAQGKREPTVHKRMATSDEVYLNEGEVDAWMDVFGADDDD
ncbi:MAG: NYN domain-containing protein [Anaerolineae bacterium]